MYLKRLDIYGFKTFAQRTTLEFQPGVTAVVGPNGSGKCVDGDTMITLADGRDVPIRDLVDKALAHAGCVQVLDDGLLTCDNPQAVQILSLNPSTLRIESQPVAAFVKRSAPSHLLKIRTRSGREVTATPYHPLFTLKDGQLHALKAEELQIGVPIAVPRLLPITGKVVPLDPCDVATQFAERDAMYVPNSALLRAWATAARTTCGTGMAWAQAAGVAETQLRGLFGGQAVNTAVLARLANVVGSWPSLPGCFKSHGSGHMTLPPTYSADLARFLGLLIAEGRNTSANQVWFVNADPLVSNEFERLAHQLFNLPVHRKRYKPNAEDSLIYSRTLGRVLERVFHFPVNSASADKVVPPQMFASEAAVQWSFLSGLFEGDAHVHTVYRAKAQPYIEYTTASPQLARGVVALLLRLGVFATIRSKERYAANTAAHRRRAYYSVYMYGSQQLRHVAQNLSFVGAKQHALNVLRQLPPVTNPNHDLVPGTTSLVKLAAQKAGVSIKRHRAQCPKLAAYHEQRCRASRWGLLEVADQIERLGNTPNDAQHMLHQLRTLATADVYWDDIVSIEQVVPSDPWVYDLCVAVTHNFVANNIVVHNSNVADAVRWVLGEQSFGNLRSKRTDDLIFGGGNKRAPMGFAEVFLTIDNSDRLLPLDFDEVTIGRRAYRNGENEYTINRARVRLRDVLNAVAPLGSSYTLINQGLVDSALALQPEERRRLFEDAAEIGPYQAKKAEAERRLRETEANLLRLNDLVSEGEPQLRTLKRQARDADAVHAVQAELHTLLQTFYAVQWARVVAQLDAAKAHEQAVAERLAAARTAREEAESALEVARVRVRHDRQTGEHRRTLLVQAEREQFTAARELAVAQERLAGVNQRAATQEQRRQALADAQAAAHADATRLAHSIEAARAALRDAREQLAQAERGIEHVRAEREVAEQDVGARRGALLRATTATETARAQVAQAQRRSAALANELDTTAAQLRRAEGERDGRGAAVASAQQSLDVSDRRLRAAAQALEAHAAERETLRQTREQIDEQLSTAWRTHGERQTRYDALSRLARSYEGTFAGVRAAMQWAEQAGHQFKLVSSLLRVPPELETAIEVALGARLQQIVAERWTDADAAIAQLKRTNAGRATFLPLDTLRPAPRRAAPTMAGVRGVAADLVDVDAHYGQIGAYLLGRTLIADDLQAARRALPTLDGGWMIVTLAGEQVASGGALTGGAATKESGTLRRERELRELPTQIDAARAEVDRLQGEREQVVQRNAALQQTIKTSETALRDARAARDGTQRMLETQRRDLHRAEDALQTLARRQMTVHDEQGSVRDQQAAFARTIEQAETAQATAQVVLDTAQQTLAECRTAVNEAEQRLEPLRTAQATMAANLRSAEAEARAAEQTFARLANEQRVLDVQQADLAREQAALGNQIARVQAAYTHVNATVTAATDQVTASELALRTAEQALEALEQRARESTSALLNLEGAHADAALAAQRSQNERDALWERAAEDNIDVEQLATQRVPGNQQSAISSHEIDPSLVQRIDQLKTRVRRMGPVNALAPAEYQAAQERHTFLSEQLADVRAATASLRTAIGDLDEMMQARFVTTFDAIGHEFERSFKQLFGGGSAKLSLVREAEGGAVGGVEIVAQPPGKRLMNLQLLSGGERSLTAAALLFAILKVNPSPFCMLDEVDAALDEANVVRFREALLELAERTQFVIITHNRGTVEAANTLYGITMGNDGGSRMLSLRLEEVDADGSLALVT